MQDNQDYDTRTDEVQREYKTIQEKTFPMGPWKFFVDLILPADNGPGVDSPSNRNEYQASSLGVKTAGA